MEDNSIPINSSVHIEDVDEKSTENINIDIDDIDLDNIADNMIEKEKIEEEKNSKIKSIDENLDNVNNINCTEELLEDNSKEEKLLEDNSKEEELLEDDSKEEELLEDDSKEEELLEDNSKEKSKTNDIHFDKDGRKIKGENAFIISGYKNGNTVFVSDISLEDKEIQWTTNLLEAHTFIENKLEETLFLLKELYFETDEIANIEIRKFYWSKYNSLNKYFSDLELRLENIKSKMSNEEYLFLINYKDKI